MKRAQPEQHFQMQVVELLRLMLGGNAMVFHIPNGGKRSLAEAKRFKAMGVMPGVPDLQIVDGGRSYFIELKAGRGAVTEKQRECHAALGRAGCPVAVVREADELIAALRQWGIALRGEWHVPGSPIADQLPRSSGVTRQSIAVHEVPA